MVKEPGSRLRTSDEIAQALTLTVIYADRTQTTRSHSLTEPTAHSPALAATARKRLTGVGLQRARVRALTVRAERLRRAEHAVRQLTFNHAVDKALLIEDVQDPARRRYGRYVSKPARLARRPSVGTNK
ncbi:hypothetical protein HFP43_00525 [Streptomyces sp. SJ1-7]|nr:hypothetical protein [Streptomyces sp. SJ1-7]